MGLFLRSRSPGKAGWLHPDRAGRTHASGRLWSLESVL